MVINTVNIKIKMYTQHTYYKRVEVHIFIPVNSIQSSKKRIFKILCIKKRQKHILAQYNEPSITKMHQ